MSQLDSLQDFAGIKPKKSKKKMIKDPQLKRFLLQEINTMALLNHGNIVKLLKTF